MNLLMQPGKAKTLIIIALSILGVIIVTSLGISFLLNNGSNTGQHSGTPSAQVPVASPLLFGTNIDLLDSKNQAFTSTTTQSGLRNLHIRIVRIPMRANASDAAIKQALEYVKDLEALPLVNLRGLSGPDGVRNVTRIVKVVNQVFNNTLVYYEYGNEDDLSGMTADQYTANWNQIVPTIKQLAPQAQVMGPSTYRYDSHYLSTFLQKARPIPDAVSWHAYTCEEGTAKEQCLQHIHDWSQNADNARQVMQQVTGKTLPIMLTEWNYAPNATNNDGKSNDEDFMSKWTLQALQTLRSAQVYASMQFAATNSTTALINSDGTLTAQGLALQETYDNWSISGSTTPTTPAGTVTPTQGANQTPTPTPAQSPAATPKPGTNPTPAPTQPPAPPDPMQIYKQATSGQPLYSSSLAAQDGGKWDVVNNSNGGYCAFVNSSYHAYAPGQKSYTPCMSHVTYPADFAVQVEMTVREGEGGGVIVRAANSGGYNNQYRLRLGVNGSYSLASQDRASIISGSSAAIKTGIGQVNVITIVGSKTTLYLYVNGQLLQVVSNVIQHDGQIGFFADTSNQPTEVIFKNVKVWRF